MKIKHLKHYQRVLIGEEPRAPGEPFAIDKRSGATIIGAECTRCVLGYCCGKSG